MEIQKQNITNLVGNTPLIALERINTNPNVTIWCKLEGKNPGGSVKDRAALYMIRSALAEKQIGPNTTIIEATSGNTGIALAMIAAIYHISIELVMPEDSTRERVQTMRAYGATVILTPASAGMEGAIDLVNEKIQQPGYIKLDQFANPNNPQAHYETTGPEIWRDTNGKVTHFISAMGTTGTIMGTGRFLKAKSKSINIIGVQPAEDSKIPGIRRWPQAYLPAIYDPALVDKIIPATAQQAQKTARLLTAQEGIFCGMSSGGAVHAALELSKTLTSGELVCIICDRGDRYLSSDLFS